MDVITALTANQSLSEMLLFTEDRTCISCLQTKPFGEFGLQVKSTGQRKTKCKICCAIYMKQYRSANNAEISSYNAKYSAENRAKLSANKKAWKALNKSHVKQYDTEYLNKNKEAINRRRRERYPERAAIVLKATKVWRAKNLDKWNEKTARYRANKRNRYKPFDRELLKLVESEAFHLSILRRAATNLDWQVDHIVPLQSELVSGLHNEFNLQVITRVANRIKSNKFWPDMP